MHLNPVYKANLSSVDPQKTHCDDPIEKRPSSKFALDLCAKNLRDLPLAVREVAEKITNLDISFNYFTQLPPEVGNLKALKKLLAFNNNLKQLPPQIGALEQLEKLNVDQNRLTSLPPEIGNLKAVKNLSANSNTLTSLPQEIGNLEALTRLDVCQNHLCELPAAIGRLKNLRDLFVFRNQLTQLPSEIGDLENLSYFDVQDNKLTRLSREISNLKNLWSLCIRDNPLEEFPVLPINLHQLMIDKSQASKFEREINDLKREKPKLEVWVYGQGVYEPDAKSYCDFVWGPLDLDRV